MLNVLADVNPTEGCAQQAQCRYLVTLRHGTEINVKDRLQINGLTYAIVSNSTERNSQAGVRLLVDQGS